VRPVDTGGVVSAAWLAVLLTSLLLFPRLWTGRTARLVGAGLLTGYVVYCFVALR
jgi:hypothetical protein